MMAVWGCERHNPGMAFSSTSAAMAFGRGRFFVSTYLNPKLMNEEDWHIYAGLLKWARANVDVLRQTCVVPSDLGAGEPYIYAHWSGKRGILAVRNPSNESKTFVVDLVRAGAPRDLTEAVCYSQYPYRKGLASGLTGHSTFRVMMQPWELVFLEIVPAAALKEAIVIGGRWTRGPGGMASVVPDREASKLRLLEPGGTERSRIERNLVEGIHHDILRACRARHPKEQAYAKTDSKNVPFRGRRHYCLL